MKLIKISIILTLILAQSLFGATYYVDAINGLDSNAGTSGAPWKTINKVGTGSSAGDTIHIVTVDAGVFDVNWPLGRTYKASGVTQYGITWTFDSEKTVGQFVNGDYYVVGSTNVTDITPGTKTINQTGATVQTPVDTLKSCIVNGSEINPTSTTVTDLKQGFDNRLTAYTASRNVGNSVSLTSGQSLVSSISWDQNDTDFHLIRWVNEYASWPTLKYAAVLTCLATEPAVGSFRPPFSGTEKVIYNFSNVNTGLLPNLSSAGISFIDGTGTVSLTAAMLIERTKRIWLDISGDDASYLSAYYNFPGYGQSAQDRFSQATLMTCLQTGSYMSADEKRKLIINLVQHGIDKYYAFKAGLYSGDSGGGHGQGRKLPIIYAAMLLNNSEMKTALQTTWVGDVRRFIEDSQTFYITSTQTNAFVGSTRHNCTVYQDGSVYKIAVQSSDPNWLVDDRGVYKSHISRRYPWEAYVRLIYPDGSTVYAMADETDSTNRVLKMETPARYVKNVDLKAGTGVTVDCNSFPKYMLGWPEFTVGNIYKNPTNIDRSYLQTAGNGFNGQALTALMLNAKSVWNHDAFFDYCDRYQAEWGSGYRTYSKFVDSMWLKYRANYGHIWSPSPPPGGADNNPPVLNPIGNKSINVGSTLTFAITATDADGDSLTYSTGTLPSGASFNAGTRTFTWTPASGQAGTYQAAFTVSDGKDTDSETITITVHSVNSAPVLAAIGNKTVNENVQMSFTVTASDADGDTLTYSAANLSSGATFANRVFSWTPNYNQSGSYSVTITVSDGALSDSETITITVNNTNQPPILAAIGNKTVAEGTALSFSITAADPEGSAITYQAANLPSGATFTGQSFTWTPNYSQAGTYSVTFSANDGAASDTEMITITVTNTNRAPVLNAIGNKNVNEGQSLSFTISATDGDSQTLTYSAQNLPAGATFANRVFSWTPTFLQAGSYSVTLSVTDGTLTDSETITITVANVTAPPVLTAIGNKMVAEGTALSFSITATDPEGLGITYQAANLPSGSSFAGQSFTWTPNYSQEGSYSVTFTASDGSASDSETITITVTGVNMAPVVADIPEKTAYKAVEFSLTIDANDPDNDELTYSASGLPAGASFASATKTFTWTPADSQVGTSYSVTFAVSDGKLSRSKVAVIKVEDNKVMGNIGKFLDSWIPAAN